MDEKVATIAVPSLGFVPGTADNKTLFEFLKAEWKEESRCMSNSAQMAMLKSYQRIIGMGWPAAPLMLEELRREPDHWFWALEAITGENPVSPEIAGKVRLMAQAWIEWGEGHLEKIKICIKDHSQTQRIFEGKAL